MIVAMSERAYRAGPGRPAKDGNVVKCRLQDSELQAIEEFAAQRGLSRIDAIGALAVQALNDPDNQVSQLSGVA
jgi:hypothetical protein